MHIQLFKFTCTCFGDWHIHTKTYTILCMLDDWCKIAINYSKEMQHADTELLNTYQELILLFMAEQQQTTKKTTYTKTWLGRYMLSTLIVRDVSTRSWPWGHFGWPWPWECPLEPWPCACGLGMDKGPLASITKEKLCMIRKVCLLSWW